MNHHYWSGDTCIACQVRRGRRLIEFSQAAIAAFLWTAVLVAAFLIGSTR